MICKLPLGLGDLHAWRRGPSRGLAWALTPARRLFGHTYVNVVIDRITWDFGVLVGSTPHSGPYLTLGLGPLEVRAGWTSARQMDALEALSVSP